MRVKRKAPQKREETDTMSPFRLAFLAGCTVALLGAVYLSYYGVGRESSGIATAASIRAGSPGGGYNSLGRIK